jgi:hypothetical protein
VFRYSEALLGHSALSRNAGQRTAPLGINTGLGELLRTSGRGERSVNSGALKKGCGKKPPVGGQCFADDDDESHTGDFYPTTSATVQSQYCNLAPRDISPTWPDALMVLTTLVHVSCASFILFASQRVPLILIVKCQ